MITSATVVITEKKSEHMEDPYMIVPKSSYTRNSHRLFDVFIKTQVKSFVDRPGILCKEENLQISLMTQHEGRVHCKPELYNVHYPDSQIGQTQKKYWQMRCLSKTMFSYISYITLNKCSF